MSRSFEISARRGKRKKKKKGKTVLIAHGQRNPITVGIDYKIVCVNDFHAESGLTKPWAKKKKKENEERVKLADLGQIVASDYEETAATQRPNLSSNEVWIRKNEKDFFVRLQ